MFQGPEISLNGGEDRQVSESQYSGGTRVLDRFTVILDFLCHDRYEITDVFDSIPEWPVLVQFQNGLYSTNIIMIPNS